ncbi:hypothetical protein V6N12_052910 [Hibiscus sabdariffa]|uniref:Uncharacterized protein n=1 Tax=Hibiscus sabdariffa TaxID=183260 RepID=A0ABR2C318_9ROSI
MATNRVKNSQEPEQRSVVRKTRAATEGQLSLQDQKAAERFSHNMSHCFLLSSLPQESGVRGKEKREKKD